MKFLVLLLFFLLPAGLFGQGNQKFWIYYQSQTDLALRDSLHHWGAEEVYFSKWLNASSARMPDSLYHFLSVDKSLKVEKAGVLRPAAFQDPDATELSFALEQVNARAMIDHGLTGKGVKIGIIDGGFLGAPEKKSLFAVFDENRVLAYKDFITPELKPFAGNSKLDDQHGTDVWEMLGGSDRQKDIRYGLATGASFFLARTDHGAGEKRIEEDFFVEALEWMYTQGVRLINTSLGYTNGYDKDSENYTPSQMDGSSAIAKATQYAIEKKNMIIVGAAGNEGNVSWKVINTPADARDVIAVGASKNSLLDKMSYSSEGPVFLDYLKPELTCFSASGTSFAAPVITGIIACMLEMDSTLTSETIRSLLFRSCDLFPYGNNYIGYGNPDAEKILQLMSGDKAPETAVRTISIPARRSLFGFLFSGKKKQFFRFRPGGRSVVVYHKYDGWKVLSRELIIPEKRWLMLRRPDKATSSTVIAGEIYYELLWE